MPGKVNPVMSEMMMQVAAQVVGNDPTFTWSAANGNFELNVMMPVLSHNLSESISILATAARVQLALELLRKKAIAGIIIYYLKVWRD